MLIIFEQVLMLFVFAAAGYALCKGHIVNAGHSQILSKLLIYVFASCNTFKTFAAKFTFDYIRNYYKMVISSLVIIVILAVAMHFVAKLFAKKKYERGIYEYTLIVPNYGYMGYALAEGILGANGLMNMMMFALPVNFYTYTVGYSILTKRPLSIKKLLNPVIIAIFAGMIVGILEIPLPDVIMSAMDKSSACMAPVSMLLAGIAVSEFELKKLLCNKMNFIAVFFRLILIPVVLGGVLSIFCSREIVQTVVLFYAMPCGLNTIVFPKMIDENCEIGAGLAFISNVLACISIPIIFTIFKIGG